MKRVSITILLIFFVASWSMAQDLDGKYATELLPVGTKAPKFKLYSPEGRTYSSRQYHKKYAVLVFWASWCPDCLKEAPTLVELYQQYYPYDIEFVGISFDTDYKRWQDAIDKFDIQYAQVSELKPWKQTSISKAYHIKWIPTIYVIDPEGKVALATVLVDKLKTFLQGLTIE